VLQRPRLFERLHAASTHRVVLLAAPAGYGKTTLLADWLADLRDLPRPGRNLAAAWLTLDAADNDPQRFLAYLIAALTLLPPTQRAHANALLTLNPLPPAETILADLLNDLAETLMQGETELLIIFDDYHQIEQGAVQRAIGFLIDHLPPRAHVLIATRADPPLPLARMRARGHLAELRAAELSFTPEEAAAFLLETMELQLERDEVAALITRTEGWAAGLHLAAIALRDRTDRTVFVDQFVRNHRYIVDYLLEDVFARQPPHVQTFLLQTSILDRLCGPLCDALLGVNDPQNDSALQPVPIDPQPAPITEERSYSRLLINGLQRENLFLVPLDAEGHWFRYHHLFVEVLRERLSSGAPPEQIMLLHRRASAWYAAHGMITAAVDHALKAGAIDDVVAILEPIGLEMATRVGEATLRSWMPAIPQEIAAAHPRLALLYAWLATFDYAPSEATRWVQIAEAALARVASGEGGGIGNVTNLRGEIAAVRTRIATLAGNAAQVIASATDALTWLQADTWALRTRIAKELGYAYMVQHNYGQAELAFADAMVNGFGTGYPYISFIATSDYAYTRMIDGALRDAVAACRRTLNYAQDHGHATAPGSGLPYLALADVYYQRREFAGALPALAEASARITMGSTTSFVMQMIVEARVIGAYEHPTAAFSPIRRARFMVQQRNMRWASAILDSLEAQVQIRCGELALAARLLERAHQRDLPAEFDYFPPVRIYVAEHYEIAPIQLRQAQIATADAPAHQAFAHDLTSLIDTADSTGTRWSQIKLRLIQALALNAAGDRDRSLGVLIAALERGSHEGFIQVFCAEGAPLIHLLGCLFAAPIWSERTDSALHTYAQRIYDQLTVHGMPATPAPPIPIPAAPPIEPAAPAPTSTLPEPLSQRELDVLSLMADGHSNSEIAAHLVIAISTVKSHVNNIFSKLGVATRTQAIARARRLNLI
jgi:LuxR family maltose regulon positive regulatory protein